MIAIAWKMGCGIIGVVFAILAIVCAFGFYHPDQTTIEVGALLAMSVVWARAGSLGSTNA